MNPYDPVKIKDLRPLHDYVMIRDMQFGERQLSSRIVLLGDDGKSAGIRPRWGQVFRVGPNQQEIRPGQWILVAHGRWTRGTRLEINGEVITVRRVDNNDILLISDEDPGVDELISDHA